MWKNNDGVLNGEDDSPLSQEGFYVDPEDVEGMDESFDYYYELGDEDGECNFYWNEMSYRKWHKSCVYSDESAFEKTEWDLFLTE